MKNHKFLDQDVCVIAHWNRIPQTITQGQIYNHQPTVIYTPARNKSKTWYNLISTDEIQKSNQVLKILNSNAPLSEAKGTKQRKKSMLMLQSHPTLKFLALHSLTDKTPAFKQLLLLPETSKCCNLCHYLQFSISSNGKRKNSFNWCWYYSSRISLRKYCLCRTG